MVIQGYPAGTTTAYDFTLTSPFQSTCLEGEAREPGYAITQAENSKIAKHKPDCDSQGIRFVPVAFHTTGGFSEIGRKEVKAVAGHMARTQGEDDSQVTLHCYQRISMAIQRGNASMLAARMPTVHQEVDGVQEDSGYV